MEISRQKLVQEHLDYVNKHKKAVADNLFKLSMCRNQSINYQTHKTLTDRALNHDNSKLYNKEEYEGYLNMNQELANVKFGTPEYDRIRKKYDGVITLHYKNNSHHPEHYTLEPNHYSLEDSVNKAMTIEDILEMVCDWCGVIISKGLQKEYKENLEINKKRFFINDEIWEKIMEIAEFLINDKPLPHDSLLDELIKMNHISGNN